MNPVSWSAATWSVAASVTTSLGFVLAAWALVLQLVDRRRRDAQNITAWVEDQYDASDDGGFLRKTSLHVSNSNDRPVFDVQIVVGYGIFGQPVIRIGALATPTIPVLPPEQHYQWSIERNIASVQVQGELRAEVSFRDSANRWWTRDFRGRVKRWRRRFRGKQLKRAKDPDLATEQIGEISMENPVAVALAFAASASDPDSSERLETLAALCTPESLPAWANFDGVRESLEGHGLATFPSYPAPGIAYVKLPEEIAEVSVADRPTLVSAKILTLQYREDLDPAGWRVFALGPPVEPDRIPPPGRG